MTLLVRLNKQNDSLLIFKCSARSTGEGGFTFVFGRSFTLVMFARSLAYFRAANVAQLIPPIAASYRAAPRARKGEEEIRKPVASTFLRG